MKVIDPSMRKTIVEWAKGLEIRIEMDKNGEYHIIGDETIPSSLSYRWYTDALAKLQDRRLQYFEHMSFKKDWGHE